MNIPAAPDSLKRAIKRARLQTFILLRCCSKIFKLLIQENWGVN